MTFYLSGTEADLISTSANQRLSTYNITGMDGAVGLEPMETKQNTKQENAAYCASANAALETMCAFTGLCPLCLEFLGSRLGPQK